MGKLNRVEQQDNLLMSKLGLQSSNPERPKEGIFKNVFSGALLCNQLKNKKKLLASDDEQNESDEDKIEEHLYINEYVELGDGKQKKDKKNEKALIKSLEKALAPTSNKTIEHDIDSVTQPDDTVTQPKKKRKKNKKKMDPLTEKALEMLDEDVIKEIPKEKVEYRRENPKTTKAVDQSKAMKRKRLQSDSEETSEDEGESKIKAINEKMHFVNTFKKIKGNSGTAEERKKRKRKSKTKTYQLSKKAKKLAQKLEEDLDLTS